MMSGSDGSVVTPTSKKRKSNKEDEKPTGNNVEGRVATIMLTMIIIRKRVLDNQLSPKDLKRSSIEQPWSDIPSIQHISSRFPDNNGDKNNDDANESSSSSNEDKVTMNIYNKSDNSIVGRYRRTGGLGFATPSLRFQQYQYTIRHVPYLVHRTWPSF